VVDRILDLDGKREVITLPPNAGEACARSESINQCGVMKRVALKAHAAVDYQLAVRPP